MLNGEQPVLLVQGRKVIQLLVKSWSQGWSVDGIADEHLGQAPNPNPRAVEISLQAVVTGDRSRRQEHVDLALAILTGEVDRELLKPALAALRLKREAAK